MVKDSAAQIELGRSFLQEEQFMKKCKFSLVLLLKHLIFGKLVCYFL